MLALGRYHSDPVALCGSTINVAPFIEFHAIATDRVELFPVGDHAVGLYVIAPDLPSTYVQGLFVGGKGDAVWLNLFIEKFYLAVFDPKYRAVVQFLRGARVA